MQNIWNYIQNKKILNCNLDLNNEFIIYFDKKINTRNTYLEIRDYVDTLYNTLPSSVQKPRIFSSDVNDNSVITIAINGETDLEILRAYIDEHIKPKIESVDGVSEVIVAGGNVKLCTYFVKQLGSSSKC